MYIINLKQEHPIAELHSLRAIFKLMKKVIINQICYIKYFISSIIKKYLYVHMRNMKNSHWNLIFAPAFRLNNWNRSTIAIFTSNLCFFRIPYLKTMKRRCGWGLHTFLDPECKEMIMVWFSRFGYIIPSLNILPHSDFQL